MQKNPGYRLPVEKHSDEGVNLVKLVHMLKRMRTSKPVYPKWAKFDSRDTMSDNNGGVIKF